MNTLNSLTEEQIAITNSSGNIKINAVAGSGKTTTIIEYAASRPQGSKMLYLAFNKSVKQDAERKFSKLNVSNIQVETAHSLAFRNIVRGRKYEIKANGYKTHELVDVLEIAGSSEKHTEYVIANHINKFASYFCNSNASKINELNYLDIVFDKKASTFVNSFYKVIEEGTRLLLAKMNDSKIPIIHDFYLKKFQLSKPILKFDYILFDEGQDASMAMLDVFLKQEAIKVIVGDTHQQIYGWRHAINSLAKTDFNALQLSTSFRFPQQIADLAKAILDWKMHLGEFVAPTITGKGTSNTQQSKATIARSNLGLLFNAIDYVTNNRSIKGIYFEGNIHSYTYADDGASLYDVLSLYNQRHSSIPDKLIASMNDLEELEEYIEKTEDVQLGMLVELVREYGNEIPEIINGLKKLHVGDESRESAEMIFSTVHKSKGMEYDVVYLANDFITEAKIESLTGVKKNQESQPADYSKINEEINLLYVAITRTKNILHIPETLVPANFPSSPHIQLVKVEEPESEPEESVSSFVPPNNLQIPSRITAKSYSFEQKREVNKDAYKPWTQELDRLLKQMYNNGAAINKLAEQFGRTKGAIISRLKKLNVYEE